MATRRLGLALLLAFMVSATAFAQCYVENDGPEFGDTTLSTDNLLCIQFVAPEDLTVTGAEVFTGEQPGEMKVSIWSFDAATGLPFAELASGTWLSTAPDDWQGATFDAPVELSVGETYWMGWLPTNGAQTSIMPMPGTVLGQLYYWSPNEGITWNGPFQFASMHWKFRLYCGDTVVFTRGDGNDDATFDISDPVYLLAALFVPGSSEPDCFDAADCNDDGVFDISDTVFALASLFIPGSPPIPEPHPACGGDPTDDALDCAGYGSCP